MAAQIWDFLLFFEKNRFWSKLLVWGQNLSKNRPKSLKKYFLDFFLKIAENRNYRTSKCRISPFRRFFMFSTHFGPKLDKNLDFQKNPPKRYSAPNTFHDMVSVHEKLNRNFIFWPIVLVFSLKCAQDQGLPGNRVNKGETSFLRSLKRPFLKFFVCFENGQNWKSPFYDFGPEMDNFGQNQKNSKNNKKSH